VVFRTTTSFWVIIETLLPSGLRITPPILSLERIGGPWRLLRKDIPTCTELSLEIAMRFAIVTHFRRDKGFVMENPEAMGMPFVDFHTC